MLFQIPVSVYFDIFISHLLDSDLKLCVHVLLDFSWPFRSTYQGRYLDKTKVFVPSTLPLDLTAHGGHSVIKYPKQRCDYLSGEQSKNACDNHLTSSSYTPLQLRSLSPVHLEKKMTLLEDPSRLTRMTT